MVIEEEKKSNICKYQKHKFTWCKRVLMIYIIQEHGLIELNSKKEVMQLMLHSSIQGFVELWWYFGWELLFNQFKL